MAEDLRFHNGKFTIMQIADAQEIPTVNPDTIKLISRALDKVKPDLVVFTGDQLKGYSPLFKGNTYRKISRTIADLLRPLEERSIPFCVTFGNHDCNCGIANAKQMPIYRAHKGFIGGKVREETAAKAKTAPMRRSHRSECNGSARNETVCRVKTTDICRRWCSSTFRSPNTTTRSCVLKKAQKEQYVPSGFISRRLLPFLVQSERRKQSCTRGG